MGKLQWCGYLMVKNFEDTISLLVFTELTNVTDGQTDRQTPHDGIGRTCKASHGNNNDDDEMKRACTPGITDGTPRIIKLGTFFSAAIQGGTITQQRSTDKS